MAAGSDFTIQLSGRGGHAASPHLTSDPVVAASFLVTAIHTVVSRQVDPLVPVVITVGAVDAGTAENVIPEEASLRGTIRCFEGETMSEVVRRIQHLAEGIAGAFGATCAFHVEEGYPATRNDEKVAESVRGVLEEKLGEGALSVQNVVHRIYPDLIRPKAPSTVEKLKDLARRPVRGIRINDISSLMIRMAQCCRPVPGDPVVGIITRGRGVSVHRQDCPNSFEDKVEPERRIEVSWDVAREDLFLVQVEIHGSDRASMLADVAQAVQVLVVSICEVKCLLTFLSLLLGDLENVNVEVVETIHH